LKLWSKLRLREIHARLCNVKTHSRSIDHTLVLGALAIMLRAYRWVLATLPFLVFVVASSGDRSSNFQSCVSACHGNYCHPQTTLPLALRLTRWTCTDDCKYQCMHMLTDIAIRESSTIHQYHGKWPFWRLFGMQEPASVAFSLWNMYYHVQGWRQLRSRMPSDHPMRYYYLTWAIVSINAWFWSAVFHTRGLPSIYV
jgi:hypothetical protein